MTLSDISVSPRLSDFLRFFYLFVGEWVIEKEREMKVVAFNGSARKDGNTAILVNAVFKELKKEKIKTELIQLAGKKIRGCTACRKCFENQDKRCAVTDDAANEYIGKMLKAQGIVLGSPVYFADVTPEMKALIDRVGYVSRVNGGLYRNKVGAAVAVLRRSGGMHAIDSMNHFLQSQEIFIAGRAIAFGRDKGEVERDEEGIQLAKSLGQRMAWLMKKVHG
jgi:multimeric flavodoxin WrbA